MISNEIKIKIKQHWSDFRSQGKECIKEFLNKDTRKKQIPNMFTASRLLAPFFIIPSALCGNILLTALFSGMFVLTDAADGFFARKYHATSEFGRKLDPITDKVFAGSLLIPLMVINPLTIINFIGEAIIASINTHSQLNNNIPRTVLAGKVKTVALYTTIALSYVSFTVGISPEIIDFFIGATAVLQGLTGYKYYKAYKDNEKKKKFDLEEEIYQQTKIENEEKIEKTNNKELTLKEKYEMLDSMAKELRQYTETYEEKKVNEYVKK